MLKKSKKIISLTLVTSMAFVSTASVFAQNQELEQNIQESQVEAQLVQDISNQNREDESTQNEVKQNISDNSIEEYQSAPKLNQNIDNLSMEVETEQNIPVEAYSIGAGVVFFTPAVAIAPGVFIALGLAATGLTIYDLYKASKSTANEIEEAWNKIPSKLKDDDGTVGIKKFSENVKGSTSRKDPKTGWVIDKDTAGHKGSKWKLKDKNGKRVASLDSEGRVVGK